MKQALRHPIADGSLLYTCRLDVPELMPGPDTPLTLSGVILSRPNGFRVCGPAATDIPCGGETLEVACGCERVEPAVLHFEVTATPPNPVVGDLVTLTFQVVNASGGLAGLPSYSLFGTGQVFERVGTPITSGQTSLGAETVSYQLRALQPGRALLQLVVQYETASGCEPPIFFFDTANSPEFELQIAAPVDTPTATPSPSPSPTDTARSTPTFSPTAHAPTTPTPSPTRAGDNSGGGCNVTPTPSSPVTLLALPVMALLVGWRRSSVRRR